MVSSVVAVAAAADGAVAVIVDGHRLFAEAMVAVAVGGDIHGIETSKR